MVKRVLGKRIFIEMLPKEEKTHSGLIIQEESKIERADIRYGIVKRSNLSEVAEGDKVLFDFLYCTPYKGNTVFLDENDILAKVVAE